MHCFQINILIFFWHLLYILSPRVHLQGDGFIYRCGICIVCFTCISVSSLVGRRLLILMHVQHIIAHLYICNRLPEDEQSG